MQEKRSNELKCKKMMRLIFNIWNSNLALLSTQDEKCVLSGVF